MHQIVNSDENTSITTEGGDVPSVAKKLKEIEATITTGVGATVAQAEAARDATDVIKSETLVIKNDAVSAQSAAENAQSLAEQAQLAAEAARDAADDIVNLGDLAYKDTVGTDNIEDGVVTANKLADASITLAKLQEDVLDNCADVDLANLSSIGLEKFGYPCRAFVNFNGSTLAINGSGNISSITSLGTGIYRITFAEPMPHANYAVSGLAVYTAYEPAMMLHTEAQTVNYCSVFCYATSGGSQLQYNPARVCVTINC